MGRTSTVTRRVTFEVPDTARVAEVQAEVTRVFSERVIVDRVSGRGQALVLTVTFGNAAEVAPLTHAAHLAALHVTPCEVRVR